MSALFRATHVIDAAPEGLNADVQAIRARGGIVQAEQYRSLGLLDNGEQEATTAVAILAESEAVYSDLIRDLKQYPAFAELVQHGRIELYDQSSYGLAEGRWAPLPEPGADALPQSVITWPARGEVSIIIQGAYEPNVEMRALTAAEIADTRREPGCVFYAWMDNVELPNHLMLLEVWADQRIYDAHWFGRMATGEYRGDSGRVATTPERGAASREFYRRQQFEFHYGRLLPASIDNYSETIVWPSR